jgi:hypothetical protein
MPEPKIRKRKITDYIPDPRNANKGTERGQYMLDASIEQTGLGRSIVVASDGTVVAGNKTLQAAIDAGLLDVIEVESDGHTLVVVRRTDWDKIEDQQARQYAYFDNRASEVGLAWDAARIIEDVNAGVDLSAMFHDDELDALLSELGNKPSAGADPGPQIDQAEELRAKWQTERGQVWEVPSVTVPGRCHRVMCGDSINADDVAFLLGGLEPRLMVTDPPYGVEYDQEWRSDNRIGKVTNDDISDWREAYRLAPSKVAYVWHAYWRAIEVQDGLLDAGFLHRNQIIWNKPRHIFSQGHYHWKHEPCFYCVRNGATAEWIGDRTQNTVWDIPADSDSPGGHSTQKPVECMARPIRNHAGDVYDPFVGSGTTIVAAEQNERICFAMELEPKYVASALERLAGMGLLPQLVEEDTYGTANETHS